jgi:hypothetical protein
MIQAVKKFKPGSWTDRSFIVGGLIGTFFGSTPLTGLLVFAASGVVFAPFSLSAPPLLPLVHLHPAMYCFSSATPQAFVACFELTAGKNRKIMMLFRFL